MNCTARFPDNTGLSSCKEAIVSSSVYLSFAFLSKDTRKVLKLLQKQYLIVSVSREAVEDLGEKVRVAPLVIQYIDRQDSRKVFEWVIEPHEINY